MFYFDLKLANLYLARLELPTCELVHLALLL